MDTVIANSSMLTPDNPRYFKVKLLSDGTPSIEGIATIQTLTEGVSTLVYSRHGGRTKGHARGTTLSTVKLFALLSKHLSPIRPGRQHRRYQNMISAVAFQYRF
jgi:hypothetical protein